MYWVCPNYPFTYATVNRSCFLDLFCEDILVFPRFILIVLSPPNRFSSYSTFLSYSIVALQFHSSKLDCQHIVSSSGKPPLHFFDSTSSATEVPTIRSQQPCTKDVGLHRWSVAVECWPTDCSWSNQRPKWSGSRHLVVNTRFHQIQYSVRVVSTCMYLRFLRHVTLVCTSTQISAWGNTAAWLSNCVSRHWRIMTLRRSLQTRWKLIRLEGGYYNWGKGN